MKFKEKALLKARIRELEYTIKIIERESNIIKDAHLPACESELCRSCVHCQTVYAYGNGPITGCSKHLDCKDFQMK